MTKKNLVEKMIIYPEDLGDVSVGDILVFPTDKRKEIVVDPRKLGLGFPNLGFEEYLRTIRMNGDYAEFCTYNLETCKSKKDINPTVYKGYSKKQDITGFITIKEEFDKVFGKTP